MLVSTIRWTKHSKYIFSAVKLKLKLMCISQKIYVWVEFENTKIEKLWKKFIINKLITRKIFFTYLKIYKFLRLKIQISMLKYFFFYSDVVFC